MAKYIFLAVLLLEIFIAGCTKNIENIPPSTSYNREVDAYYDAMRENQNYGSLWTDTKTEGTLFLDYKARNIGDIVIVEIMENSSASNTNTTDASKTTTYDASVDTFLGMPMDLGISNFLGMGEPFNPSVSAQTTNDFQGDGSKQKADQVQATVAARIVNILPSGNLVIEGSREIVVDQEKQYISVKGVIRQKDINAQNVVPSTAIADAQIYYTGKGMLSDVNKKGWLAHAIDWVWPF
ncbi:MAG: flagellar basal body L-ring protein FlgH [Deferribacterota bacterium]|nr:flagellar basal body L-ring protein FlgH [Deferribacterota bacterium]